MGSHWYLVAFCQLRNDYRNFRTDKIDKLTFTEEVISKTHPPLQSFINQMSAERQVIEVVIDVETDVVKYMGEQKYYNGFVKQEKPGRSCPSAFFNRFANGFCPLVYAVW
jgi:predicted DNA-binding transcriptional regulator YafY